VLTVLYIQMYHMLLEVKDNYQQLLLDNTLLRLFILDPLTLPGILAIHHILINLLQVKHPPIGPPQSVPDLDKERP
jgi:hypothetical protein